MSRLRELQFFCEPAVAQDVRDLRAGHAQGGRWTLPQTCWHLSTALDMCLRMPARLEPNEAQRAMQGRLHQLAATRDMPSGMNAPAGTEPPADAADAAVDGFLAGLDTLAAYRETHVDFGPFGPVSIAMFRDFIFIHSAHHLGHFWPTTPVRRTGLHYRDENAAIADIRALRRGCKPIGNWTLPQVCWHLDKTMQARMRPGPFEADTPEQSARRPMFEKAMATHAIPNGLIAPEHVQPPADAGDAAIDACIATLERFRDFPGPVAPHRLFGTMSDADAHKQNLIHVAHHLSHLVASEVPSEAK